MRNSSLPDQATGKAGHWMLRITFQTVPLKYLYSPYYLADPDFGFSFEEIVTGFDEGAQAPWCDGIHY